MMSTPDQVLTMIAEQEKIIENDECKKFVKSIITQNLDNNKQREEEFEKRGFLVKPELDLAVSVDHASILKQLLKKG